MPRHHLVARNTPQHRMHHRPLGCSQLPSALYFLLWQSNNFTYTKVAVKFFVLDKDPAPDDKPRLAHPFKRPATTKKIHWWLPFTACPTVAADKVRRWRRTRDQEDPDKRIHVIVSKRLTPTYIVQGIFRIKAQFTP